MESLPSLLLGTVILRPYVFSFLLVYLVGCSLHLGVKRALLFCVIGYVITWLSEYSSIHNGFPYGRYYYIQSTLGREVWVLGVPLMDSLSYVFLAYASYSMALLLVSPLRRVRRGITLLETRTIRYAPSTALIGALFMVYLDIIIDPIALRGDRWFLGLIYGYPEGGEYFGVPISNFAGWFLVGFVLISALQGIDRFLHNRDISDSVQYRVPFRYLIGPTLYVGVILFNLTMTFAVGEYTLAWTDVFIVLFPSVFLSLVMRLRLEEGKDPAAVRRHVEDFPEVRISAALLPYD